MDAEAEAGARRPQAPSGGETQEEPSSGACGRRLSRQDLDLGLPPLDLGVPFGCCKPPACGPWSGPPQALTLGAQGRPEPKVSVDAPRMWLRHLQPQAPCLDGRTVTSPRSGAHGPQTELTRAPLPVPTWDTSILALPRLCP